MHKSKIEWTETTWNPIRGCSRVSEGCRNCYAESIANRFKGDGLPYNLVMTDKGNWNGKIEFLPHKLTEPLNWNTPKLIFVNSMSDLFHENNSIENIAAIFAVMYLCPKHTFQVLTKRSSRMQLVLSDQSFYDLVLTQANKIRRQFPNHKDCGISDPTRFPHKNVWLGVSIEDQKTADERIPELLNTPADLHWISAEPLLGKVDLTHLLDGNSKKFAPWWHELNWVVCGGESGPGARPMHPEWVESLRDQCQEFSTPFFFKQWGEWAPNCMCGKEKPCKEIDRPKPGKLGVMFRCGKKGSGRKLKNKIWDELPR